jgi:hypothetical protein
MKHRPRGGEGHMGKLAFGLWDSFGVHEMSRSAVAADIYEQHIREVQLAESLGYSSYRSSENELEIQDWLP